MLRVFAMVIDNRMIETGTLLVIQKDSYEISH
jgi:hypothetical protein